MAGVGWHAATTTPGSRWVAGSIIALLAITQSFADSAVFPHERSLYLSISDGKESGLFVCEPVNQKGPNLFLPPRRIGDTVKNLMASFPEGKMRLISPGWEYGFHPQTGLAEKQAIKLPAPLPASSLWSLADYNGDGQPDVIVFSLGADDAKARIFYGRADGTYAAPFVFQIEGKDFDATGLRSPHFVNLDDDDDLDFIHLDAQGLLIYYENRNTNSEPLYGAGRVLACRADKEKSLAAIEAVSPFDWNADGHADLIIVTRDGAIGCLPHSEVGNDGVPIFLPMISLIVTPTTPASP